jgi:hypothetical protein
MEEVGLMEFRFQPDVFERGHVSPVTDADADLLLGTSERFGRSGFTRRTVIPGLCGKYRSGPDFFSHLHAQVAINSV